VLGVDVAESEQVVPSSGSAAELLAALLDAKETVDAGLAKLASELRESGDPDQAHIADYGLFGLDGGGAVKLIAALMDARNAPPDAAAKSLDTARKAAGAWRETVLSDRTTALIDENPFGVKVGLRTTLVQALAHIENAD
jgi:hypothetical protein